MLSLIFLTSAGKAIQQIQAILKMAAGFHVSGRDDEHLDLLFTIKEELVTILAVAPMK